MTAYELLVDPSVYHWSLLGSIHLTVAFLAIINAMAVGVIERFSLLSRLFMVFSLGFVFWQLGRAGAATALNFEVQQFYLQAQYAAAWLIVVSIFHVVTLGIQQQEQRVGLLVALWTSLPVIIPLALFTPWMVDGRQSTPWGAEVSLTPFGLSLMVIAFALCATMIIDWRSGLLRLPRDSTDAKRRRMMGLSGLLLIPALTDFLAGAGVAIPALSTVFVLLYSFSFTFIVARYGWFDISTGLKVRELMNYSHSATFLLDRDGLIKFANPVACDLLSVRELDAKDHYLSEWLGKEGASSNLYALAMGGQHQYLRSPKADELAGGKAVFAMVQFLDARRMSFLLSLTIREDESNIVVRGEQRFLDPVTALPARETFESIAASVIEEDSDNYGSICVVHLTNFIRVAERFGYTAADEFRRALVRRLKYEFSDAACIGQLPANDIALLLPQSLANDTDEIKRRLMRVSFGGGDAAVHYEAVAGLSLDISADRVREAVIDAACNAWAAQEHGLNVVSEPTQSQNNDDLVLSLSNALRNGEMVFHFQPVVSIAQRRIIGFEALIRWQRLGKNVMPPSAFVEYLENGALAIHFEAWSVKQSLKFLEVLDQYQQEDVWLNINLTALDITVSGVADIIEKEFSDEKAKIHRLNLEITERTAMMVSNKDELNTLQRLGVGLAVDDFGTGYSSLSRLISLPVKKLKIDRAFVRQMTQSAAAEALVRSIVNLANELNMEVLAEGVESVEELRMLESLGVDQIQGFLFAKPSPLEHWVQLNFQIPEWPAE